MSSETEGAAKNCKDRSIYVIRANEFGLRETVIRIKSNTYTARKLIRRCTIKETPVN
jgi:hypothetical protein